MSVVSDDNSLRMADKYSKLRELQGFFQNLVSDALVASEAPEPIYPPGPRPAVNLVKYNPQLHRRHGTNILSSLCRLGNTRFLDPLELGEFFQDAAAARRRLEDFAFFRGFAIVRVIGAGDLHGDCPETYPRYQPPYTVYRCVHHQAQLGEGYLDRSTTEHITVRYGFDCPEYAALGCGWSTTVKYDRYRGVWYLKPSSYAHNHPMISNPFDYPQHEYRHPKYLNQKPPLSFGGPQTKLDLDSLFSALSADEIQYMLKYAVQKSVSDWQKINKRKAMKTSIFDLPNEILLKIARYLYLSVQARVFPECVLRFRDDSKSFDSSPGPFVEALKTRKPQPRKAEELKGLLFTNRFFARLLTPEFRKLVEDTTEKTPNFLWTIKNGYHSLCLLGLLDPKSTVFERNVNYCSNYCDGSHGQQRHRICEGGSALHHAVRQGAGTIVRKLAYHGAIVNMMNCCGQTPLCVAASRADKAMVELLLQLGANPYVSQQNAEPAASWAVRSKTGHKSSIRAIVELLENRDAAASDKSIFRTRRLSLHRAAANGHEPIIHMLTKSPNGIDISSQSPEGYTALHIAVNNRNFDISRALLAAGADCSIKDNDGNRPLNYAAINGDIPTMDLLLKSGAKVNDGAGEITALHFAALYGNVDLVRTLVDNWGADINPKDKENTLPLTYAMCATRDKVASLLLSRGAEEQVIQEERPFMVAQLKMAKKGSCGTMHQQPVHRISVHEFSPEHKYIKFVRN